MSRKYDMYKNRTSHKNIENEVRVVFYGRVSTEHESQLSALESQIQWYNDILGRHKNWVLVGEYIDKGITGTQTRKRPQFLQMVEDAHNNKFDLIVTREASRFARNTVHSLDTVQKLSQVGVEVYFVLDNIWTFDGDAELILGIMSTLAQEESRKISERVKAGQKISRDNGVLYGTGNILGYTRVGNTYQIVEEEAETIRLIYSLYIQGLSQAMISKRLTEENRKCANGAVSWRGTKVYRILSNPTYKGWMAYGKTITTDYLTHNRVTTTDVNKLEYKRGNFEAIISEEVWGKVEELRNSRAYEVTLANGGVVRKGKKVAHDIWVRKLVCQCGGHFRKIRWEIKKSGETAVGYQCYNRSNKSNGAEEKCNVKMVTDWKLNLLVKAVIEDTVDSVANKIDEAIVEKFIERVIVKEDNLFEAIVRLETAEERILLYRISGSKKAPLLVSVI